MGLFQAFTLMAAGATFLIAIVFAVRKVLNVWFCLFLVTVGLLILPFSTPIETIQESRLAYPGMFFIVNALILMIFPLFFMSTRMRLGSPLRLKDWPYFLLLGASMAVLFIESIGYDLDVFVSTMLSTPIAASRQDYMGSIRSGWQNIHHLVFSVSAVVLLFAGRAFPEEADGSEIRILRWTGVYSLTVLCASTVLEWIQPRLDLLVTSTLLSTTVFAFIVFLIVRSPALIRGARRKYERSRLTPGESEIILERLTRLMETDKAFKDPDFDLPTAARRIGTSVPNLSQSVNQGLHASFNRMLNGYRVREAMRLLSESGLSVTEIAFEAGFGSLSSFNAIFKADCGISPSQFRRKRK